MSTHPPRTNLSPDHVGAFLVTILATGMVLAPGISWMLGEPVSGTAIGVRVMVATLSVLLAWLPVPVPAAWRRMLAVSLLAAHHVGVGVAVGLPGMLLVELVAGAVFIGGLACWLLPRSGFGALLGLTLAAGTLALGLLPPGADPVVLGLWSSVFVLGGLSAELSVWVGPRIPPPGFTPGAGPSPAPEPLPPEPRGAGMALAEQVGLGVATMRPTDHALTGASRHLLEMTSDWTSPEAWWQQVVDRQRAPRSGRGPTVIEMFTPGMQRRRAYRMWAVDETGGRRVYVQDISAATDARREAERLARSIEAARMEADAARDARMATLRSRSHHLRTPLSNLMASLELATMSVDEGASLGIVQVDLDSASTSARELLGELDKLVEDIVSDGNQAVADDVVDLVGLVDSELDSLQAARSVRRSYGEAALPVRGPRGELTALVQAVVRRGVVAARGAILVRIELSEPDACQVIFRVSEQDAELVWSAIRELAPRAASLGGRLDAGGGRTPALVLPQDSRARAGLEAEITWPGMVPGVSAPEPAAIDYASLDDTDDDPTHVGFARRQAIDAPQTKPRSTG